MPQHIAQWNPTTQLWETQQADLFSEQQEPYSDTWPTSGMTRNGQLLPLPMSGHPIGENESSSLLPTPRSVQALDCNNKIYRRYNSDGEIDDRGNLECAIAEIPHVSQMLPTPRATDGTKGGPNQRRSSADLMLPSAVMNLDE